MSAEGRARIGVLYPGYGAEEEWLHDDYPRLADAIVPPVDLHMVHTNPGGWGVHTIESVKRSGLPENLLPGAEQLKVSNIDSCMWACTSGSFTYGLEGARRQAQKIADVLGVPSSSTSLAFLSALRALEIDRVAIAATYPEELANAFQTFLNDGGVEVLHLDSMAVWTGIEASEMDRERLLGFVRDHAHPDVDAVLVPDTALHTVPYLAELDSEAGKPVLTANQVTMWDALRLANRLTPQSGLGQLMATTPSVPPVTSTWTG